MKNELRDHSYAKTVERTMNRRRTSVDVKMNKFEKDNLELQKRSQGIVKNQ